MQSLSATQTVHDIATIADTLQIAGLERDFKAILSRLLDQNAKQLEQTDRYLELKERELGLEEKKESRLESKQTKSQESEK